MRKKKLSFVIAVIFSVLVLLFCTTQTVMSQNSTDSRGEKQYYAQMEKEYYSNMRQMLTEMGYSDSGITIRWVSNGDGMRTYIVMIHHRRIDRLDEKEKEELLLELAAAEFPDRRCTFQYEFLTV